MQIIKNNKRLKIKILLTLVTILFCSNFIYGQVNLKVGYTGLLLPLKASNEIFSAYNKTNTIDEPYESIKYFQGLDLGLRYRWSNTAIEGGWNYMRSKKSSALLAGESTDWHISTNEFYVGMQFFIKKISIGSQLGRTQISYRSKSPPTTKSKTFVKDAIWTPKVFLGFTAEGDMTSITFQPYYQFPSTSVNIKGFNDQLGIDSGTNMELWKGFGLTILIYNGPNY